MAVRDTLLVAGSANIDFVVRTSRIPAPGETVLGRDFSLFAGGKGANQAIACARAGGVATRMLLALGDDDFAIKLENSLADAGVLTQVVRSTLPTGTAFVCVSDEAENAITVVPGANSALCGNEIESWASISHLLLQLETPIEAVASLVCAARKDGVRIALNAAPAHPRSRELLGSIDMLIVNEGELSAITGHNGSVAECLALLDVPCVVVTLGARGCCARGHGEVLLQPGFSVHAIDTTAAGDTFCGALVASQSRGEPLLFALRYACAAAALACMHLGAQTSIPERHDVEALLLKADQRTTSTDAELAAYCGFV